MIKKCVSLIIFKFEWKEKKREYRKHKEIIINNLPYTVKYWNIIQIYPVETLPGIIWLLLYFPKNNKRQYL